MLGGVVYFADLASRDTHGLNVRTGKRVFRFRNGGFAPPITDGKTLWLTGYSAQFAFKPARAGKRSERRARGKRRDRGRS